MENTKGIRGNLLEKAQRWIDEYDVSVVPVRYMSKVPMVKWVPWTERRPPKPLVEFWFRSYPINMAVVIGGGLCVIDFDKPIEYLFWKERNEHLAKSYTVKTGRGWHVYLWLMEWEKKIFRHKGGEMKCAGLAISPPSTHASGKKYREVFENAGILGVAGIDDLGIELIEEISWRAGGGKGSDRKNGCCGTVAKIKSEINIAVFLSGYTRLKDNGDGSLMGVCPFHDDHVPSLQVWPKEGRCYCHSPNCIAHRQVDVIAAYAYLMNVPMDQATYMLAAEL